MPKPLAYSAQNALNAICPYFTMFPLEYPLRVLKSHRKSQPVIMDPFCGRGTTLFAARQLGLVAYGIDSSRVAVAIAQAKLCKVDMESTLALAEKYINTEQVHDLPTSEFFQQAFNPVVLRQICAIRQGLLNINRENGSSVLLRATMLGCLHGPMSKSLAKQSYFSNQMPRTFASKPNYSVNFWKSRNLVAPNLNVIDVLYRKLSRIQDLELPENSTINNVCEGDSRYAKSLPVKKRNFSIVITSPPYYGMKTYVEDQWLRNWFLGGSDYVKYGEITQLEHKSLDSFIASLAAVWRNMARTNANNLRMYIRFGSIPSAHTNPKQLISNSLEESGILWQIVSTRPAATASSGRRQANHMSAKSVAALEYDFHIIRK